MSAGGEGAGPCDAWMRRQVSSPQGEAIASNRKGARVGTVAPTAMGNHGSSDAVGASAPWPATESANMDGALKRTSAGAIRGSCPRAGSVARIAPPTMGASAR